MESGEKDSSSPPNGIGEEIASFVHNIDALQFSLPVFTVLSAGMSIACVEDLDDFLKKNGTKTAESDSTETFTLGTEHALELSRLSARLRKAKAGQRLLPQSFVVALVSQYDSFLGGLLRCFYRARPELLKQSGKQLTYSQLSEFENLEDAKEHILEKEIEDLLRESHSAQFEWMEKQFDLPLRKAV
jgi:hypothetical protein